ncbi:MAG: 3-hydroxy-5-methyl-naphthoate 3-O-methyltransferase [Actinomycetota bacterium]|nr:3-hydroxy-5-methyl-naphthoate 3-O-methyltransferase [Actinomycetota bacterium]
MEVTPDPDDVLELFLGFWISRTVMAAVELGVFEILDAEQAGEGLTLEEAQAALGLAARPARALLDTCVATGLLDKEDGRYRNSLLAARYLSSRSTHSLRNYVLDERWCWPAWGRLEDALRADHQLLPEDQEGYHAFPEDFFLDFLHGHSGVMGDRLAEGVDLREATRIMDVGGGSGAVSIALCTAFPHLEAIVVDQPPVAAKAAGHIAEARLSERVTTWPANIFDDALPPDCDVAVLANVLHDFSPDRAREILGRVVEALPRGGRVVILEIVPDDERRSPPLAVAFSVAMIVNTAGGDAHTVPQYRAWLEAAGLVDVVVTPIEGRMVTTVIEAVKPM